MIGLLLIIAGVGLALVGYVALGVFLIFVGLVVALLFEGRWRFR